MTDAAFWNRLAEEYAAKPVENPDAFERKIEITRSLMMPTDVVLDIGCGTGSLALRLAEGGATLHGLDVSSEMMRIAKGKAEKAGAENVSFHTGAFDEDFAVFPNGSLDGVCAYSFLHLVLDWREVLSRIYDLIKPGGFFVTSTVCIKETWVPLMPLLHMMRWVGKAPRIVSLSKAQLEAAMTSVGFVDIAQPDVGAKATTAFMVASKPRA